MYSKIIEWIILALFSLDKHIKVFSELIGLILLIIAGVLATTTAALPVTIFIVCMVGVTFIIHGMTQGVFSPLKLTTTSSGEAFVTLKMLFYWQGMLILFSLFVLITNPFSWVMLAQYSLVIVSLIMNYITGCYENAPVAKEG